MAEHPVGDLVLVPREPTPAMLEAVRPFPAHLATEHPDPADPWYSAMRKATMVDQFELASLYRQLIEAWLAEAPSEGGND
jgi:hypothetical protein